MKKKDGDDAGDEPHASITRPVIDRRLFFFVVAVVVVVFGGEGAKRLRLSRIWFHSTSTLLGGL